MIHHADRDHATWSASSTERNWSCSGALALTYDLPEKTNEAADWGTACHQLAERCLRDGRQASEFIGDTEKGKTHAFEIDEEMADTAQAFIDYVRGQIVKAAPKGVNPASLLQIEQHFTLADLKPPFDAGGTADAVIYFPAIQELEVVDLKGGRGYVVEVTGNPQLYTYALGAMLANRKLKVTTVKVTIVQPRAAHKSGRIRSETFHVADLMEWTAELVDAMSKSFTALAQHPDRPKIDTYPKLERAVWNAQHLKAGSWCHFCRAAGTCPALQQKALDAAGIWFDDLDQPRLANAPSELTPEALAKALDAADMIGEWLNAVRAFAQNQAESGVEIPNYVLVEKIGHRKWNGDEASVVFALDALGVADPYVRKLVSPAQAEKLLGAKRKSEIAGLVNRPVTGSSLVRADRSTRPAIPPAASKYLETFD